MTRYRASVALWFMTASAAWLCINVLRPDGLLQSNARSILGLGQVFITPDGNRQVFLSTFDNPTISRYDNASINSSKFVWELRLHSSQWRSHFWRTRFDLSIRDIDASLADACLAAVSERLSSFSDAEVDLIRESLSRREYSGTLFNRTILARAVLATSLHALLIAAPIPMLYLLGDEIKRRYRQHRSLCVCCGYPLEKLGPCPECGALLTRSA